MLGKDSVKRRSQLSLTHDGWTPVRAVLLCGESVSRVGVAALCVERQAAVRPRVKPPACELLVTTTSLNRSVTLANICV
jgi:hypothetical protein